MLHEGIPGGLCLECAVRRHDFKEILGQGRCDDHFYEAPLAAAWMVVRRHRILTCFGIQGATCSECNRKVPGIYLPVD